MTEEEKSVLREAFTIITKQLGNYNKMVFDACPGPLSYMTLYNCLIVLSQLVNGEEKVLDAYIKIHRGDTK